MSNKKILINPPPENLRCECCDKHISEIEPFGGKGDPLVGDFNGAKLVKTFRGYDTEYGRNVYASWECRYCIVLDEEEYYAKCKMFKKVKRKRISKEEFDRLVKESKEREELK